MKKISVARTVIKNGKVRKCDIAGDIENPTNATMKPIINQYLLELVGNKSNPVSAIIRTQVTARKSSKSLELSFKVLEAQEIVDTEA